MQKKNAARLAGFVGALCATGALVGFSVSGTGAYFTDTHNAAIKASTGKVQVNMNPSSGELDFTNLTPGNYGTQTLDYANGGTVAEDIWLIFPTDGSSEAFEGQPDDASGGGLGRYGHFAVTSTNGASFSSYNLSRPRITPPVDGSGKPLTQPTCPVDGNGEGGSNQQAANRSDHTVPYCAPGDILLASNVAPGQGGTATFTFGFTPLLGNSKADGSSTQGSSLNTVGAYQIEGTQVGIRPDDPNN